MSTAQYDSRTADKFVARLPDGLRGQIEEAADRLDRSMNSVIVQAVKQYLDSQNRQELLLSALVEATGATSEKSSAAPDSMHIDDRVRMTANAKRYEWLRDRDRAADAEDAVFAGRGHLYLYADDLDKIDDAMRLASLQEHHI